MSVSTNGILCYGIALDEGIELPWMNEKSDNDIETWWVEEVNQWTPPFQLYNEDGEFLGGRKPPQERIDAYYNDRRKFVEDHPKLPIELVLHCSCDYSMYIISLPELVMTAYRGSPKEIVPDRLVVGNEVDEKILSFCHKYGIDIGNKIPKWWLCSLWC
jgi:hypothetical protein